MTPLRDLPLIKIFLILYNFAWRIALPFLKRLPRVALGWQQRTLQDAVQGPFDIWIQAASGGESMLTAMVLEDLAALLPKDTTWRVLVTSGTQQGIESLVTGCRIFSANSTLAITVAYFPFDAPQLMDQAFKRFSPALAVIVETELWPGFLISAKRNTVPVLLINGRMSVKSAARYRHFAGFFKKYGPEKVLAISPADGERFARIVGRERVRLINNIKFDRIETGKTVPERIQIAGLLPKSDPFLLLGSIRRQEEEKILWTIERILATRPDVVIGLFPKHVERAGHWLGLLEKKHISATKRSEMTTCVSSGSVIVWDTFGELAGAYGLARAAFVGGSLVNLGGQNFLEPLIFGLKPVIGPYWRNFAWVGREIVTAGLVQEVADENELVTELLAALDADPERDRVIQQVEEFFLPKKGGTHQVCQQIINTLTELGKI